MFYLTNTNKKNGCLRVIPGSHLKYNKVHQHIKKHHSHYWLYNDPNDPILLNFLPFLTLLPVNVLICFTNLFPRAMFTPLSL